MNRIFVLSIVSFFMQVWSVQGLLAGPQKETLIKLVVSPSQTDPNIRNKGTSHLAYVDTANLQSGKLFVFLPGTGAPPRLYTKVLETAASQGYHAIGLVYENDMSVNFHICTPQRVREDPDCHKNVRLEILDGKDRTAFVNVNRANSIENRLIKLLDYLEKTQPNLSWNQFLSNGRLQWEAFALSGHSQGGGHAALAGKIHLCQRIILFSAPEPQAWTTEPSSTPPDRFYGLVHKLEKSYLGIVTAWKKLRIPGVPMDVDVQPFSPTSQRLVTSVIPRGPQKEEGLPNYHGSVVADPFTPVQSDGITPVLRDTWIYLLTSR